MENEEKKTTKATFWVYLILSYIGLSGLKDIILEIYEIYSSYENEFDGMSIGIRLLIMIFWISFSKSTIKTTINEYKKLKYFQNQEEINENDEDIKNL